MHPSLLMLPAEERNYKVRFGSWDYLKQARAPSAPRREPGQAAVEGRGFSAID